MHLLQHSFIIFNTVLKLSSLPQGKGCEPQYYSCGKLMNFPEVKINVIHENSRKSCDSNFLLTRVFSGIRNKTKMLLHKLKSCKGQFPVTIKFCYLLYKLMCQQITNNLIRLRQTLTGIRVKLGKILNEIWNWTSEPFLWTKEVQHDIHK